MQTSTSSQLVLRFDGASSAGIKECNQDAFAAHQPASAVCRLKGAVACMADGLSSSEYAQQASQTAVTQFIEDYYSTPETWAVKNAAARVLSSMNSWFFHQSQASAQPHHGMVTTFSALICKSTTAHIFHVGDSRIYRLRDGQIEQLTRDHLNAGAQKHRYLTRALGADSRLEVDYLQEPLRAGDIFLLTTDGLHGFINDQAMMNAAACARTNGERAAQALLKAAMDNGSHDNLSALFAHVEQLPAQAIDEVHRELTERVIPPVLEPGLSIDGFEVLRVIHSGTRSHVYLVSDPIRNRQLVLKAPSEKFSDDPQYLEGFIREGWVGRRMDDRRIMKIYHQGEGSAFLYHLCELVSGSTLRQWMHDNRMPGLQKVRELAVGIVSCLRVLQRAGMVHRDLKPENIMVTESGEIKLVDFGTVLVPGLAEIESPLQEELPVGTVDYAAPEYVLGDDQQRSDLFSLGVIVYELLCGELPFKRPFNRPVPRRYSDWQYRSIAAFRKDLPKWIDLALRKAVQADPRRRYQAYSEFLEDLHRPSREMLTESNKAPLIERNPLRVWQVISAALLVVVLLQFYLMTK